VDSNWVALRYASGRTISTIWHLFEIIANLLSERKTLIMDSRAVSFITELKTQVKHTCADCHEYTLLVYLVMNDRGQMFGVCKECGTHFSTLINTP
jgi:hypothetical protein